MAANHTSSADLMSDALWSGHQFRTFNVNNDFNCESLKIEVDSSLPSVRVIRALDELSSCARRPDACVWTTAPSSLVPRKSNGRTSNGSNWCTSSRAGPRKTPISNASAAPSAPRRRIDTCSHPQGGPPRGGQPPTQLQPSPSGSFIGRSPADPLCNGTIPVTLYFRVTRKNEGASTGAHKEHADQWRRGGWAVLTQ